MESSKKSLCRPFLPSPSVCCPRNTRRQLRRAERCSTSPSPALQQSQPRWYNCCTGHAHPRMGSETDCVLTGFLSAMIQNEVPGQKYSQLATTPGLRASLFTLQLSKHLQSKLFCLKTLQIHSKHLTESQRPLACTICITSLPDVGPYSGVHRMLRNLTHAPPKAPLALSHPLK